jgi:hypothetical protein
VIVAAVVDNKHVVVVVVVVVDRSNCKIATRTEQQKTLVHILYIAVDDKARVVVAVVVVDIIQLHPSITPDRVPKKNRLGLRKVQREVVVVVVVVAVVILQESVVGTVVMTRLDKDWHTRDVVVVDPDRMSPFVARTFVAVSPIVVVVAFAVVIVVVVAVTDDDDDDDDDPVLVIVPVVVVSIDYYWMNHLSHRSGP